MQSKMPNFYLICIRNSLIFKKKNHVFALRARLK
jgi:hypothetical protein